MWLPTFWDPVHVWGILVPYIQYEVTCIENFQEELCQKDMEDCVKIVKKVDFTKECLHECEGTVVTSFDKQNVPANLMKLMKHEVKLYRKYKGYTQMPAEISGNEN